MFKRALLAIALAATIATGAAPAASAATPLHPMISANYQGWAYPVRPASCAVDCPTAKAWRWSSSGWSAASFEYGTGVYVYPFGSGWSWAYRGGTWYALPTANLASWSCDGKQSTGLWGMSDYSIAARFNNVLSTFVPTIEKQSTSVFGGDVTVLCSNVFHDASTRYATTNGSPQWQLVRGPVYSVEYVAPLTGCTRGGPCYNPGLQPKYTLIGTRTGYVRVGTDIIV